MLKIQLKEILLKQKNKFDKKFKKYRKIAFH